jgi:thioredoxin reductase
VSARVWEVIVIGGGPTGLSAALTLGRCRRSVLLCDVGQPRHRRARVLHTFLSNSELSPQQLRARGREQLLAYPTVEWRDALVVDAARSEHGFELTLLGGEIENCRKLLIATGVVDHLPAVTGIEQFYGRSVHHSPYCDGWEWRDQPLGVYGRATRGTNLALMLKQWSPDVALFTDGPADLSPQQRARLAGERIAIHEPRIARLTGHDGQLAQVVLADGAHIERRALFFDTGQQQRSALASRLGWHGSDVRSADDPDSGSGTGISGLFVAGDAFGDMQLAVVSAAEWAKAAFAINRELLHDAGRA